MLIGWWVEPDELGGISEHAVWPQSRSIRIEGVSDMQDTLLVTARTILDGMPYIQCDLNARHHSELFFCGLLWSNMAGDESARHGRDREQKTSIWVLLCQAKLNSNVASYPAVLLGLTSYQLSRIGKPIGRLTA